MQRFVLSVGCALVAFTSAGAQQLAGEARASEFVAPQGVAADGPRSNGPTSERMLDRRITLQLHGVSLDLALREIARAAELGYVYRREVLPAQQRVNLEARQMRVADALGAVFEGTGLTYGLTDAGQLTVKRVQTAEEKGRIVGRAVHATTKEPIADVQIMLDGTNRTTRTGAAGEFTLADVVPGTYVVSARKVGLVSATQRVTIAGDTLIRLEFALTPTVNRLSEVVVTSTVGEREMRSVPVEVTVITADHIREKNITNVQQLFRGDIPGVFMEDQGYLNVDPFSGRTPQVRGQNFLSATATNAGSTSFLKVYLDGMLVSDYSVVAQIDPNSIERIEVVRGPAATTMYGSGASDGVMQIFTKRGTFSAKPRVTVGLSAKAFDSPYMSNMVVSPRTDLSLTGGGDAFSYNVTGSLEREGEWVPDYKNDRKSLGLGLRWVNGPVTLQATTRYDGPNNYASPQDPFQALGLLEGRFSRVKLSDMALVPSQTTTSSRVHTTGLEMQYRATPMWNHIVRVGTNSQFSQSEQDRPRFMTPLDTLLSLMTSNRVTNTIHYNNTWNARLGNLFSSTLTTGFEYTGGTYDYNGIYNLIRVRGSLDGYSTPVRSIERNTGYFGQWELGIRDALYLTSGVRAEDNPNYGADVGLRYAPRFGAAYVIDVADATVKFRAGYGWSNRAPQPFQKDGRPTTSYERWEGDGYEFVHFLPNADLLPSEQRGGDYAVEMYKGNWLSLSATYFSQMADKDIYQSTTTDTVFLTPPLKEVHQYNQFMNLGKVQSRGWELRGRAVWREWSLSSTYSKSDNIVRSLPPQGILAGSYQNLRVGKRMDNVPRYIASATLGYTTQRTQANIATTVTGRYRALDGAAFEVLSRGIPEFVGPPISARSIIMPRMAKYDFNITQEVYKSTSVFLQVRNLFNNRSTEGYDNRLPEMGRVFLLGTRWTNN